MPQSIYEEHACKIKSHFPRIRNIRSTKKFWRSDLCREILPDLKKILDSCETGQWAPRLESNDLPPFFHAVSWNVERGMSFEGIVEVFKGDPDLAEADIYFIPETDVGMARSKNRNVARELAMSVGLNYAFTPCYLNLDKGNGPETEIEGENEIGLHGNALLSKWPIKNPRQIILKNCKDKMRGREKRIGSQRSLVADVELPTGTLRAVCLHLDAHSSQRQRYDQVKTILNCLEEESWEGPTLIGGDWNTSTYHASHAFFVFFSFWRKMLMGPKYVCENHYPYPERYFEKRLFRFLEEKKFDYKNFNALGVPTIHFHLNDEIKKKNLRDWTPALFQIFVDWAMRKVEGMASLKVDWFAARNLNPVEGSPKVVGNLFHNGAPISDHDAISCRFLLK